MRTSSTTVGSRSTKTARGMLPSTSLGEGGVESIIATPDGLVRGHLAIGLDTVLEAEKLPAGITDLVTRLTDVHGLLHALLGSSLALMVIALASPLWWLVFCPLHVRVRGRVSDV